MHFAKVSRLILGLTAFFALSASALAQSGEREFNVVRVDVRGNRIVSTQTILNNMKTRSGASLTQSVINEDIKRLYGTGFFQDIRIDVEDVSGGVRVIVTVEEKPIIRYVVIEGFESIKERDLRKDLDLIEGQVLDEFNIKKGINKVKERYAKKGFRFVNVKYRVETNRATKEATVTITIDEGAKYRVKAVTFEGATTFKSRRLLKLMKTKPRRLWLFRFGTFRENVFQDDLDRITSFYQWNGFLDVRVGHEIEYDDEHEAIKIKVLIEEGNRYVTDKVAIEGITVLPENEIWQRLQMLPGSIYSQQGVAGEVQAMKNFYYEHGYMAVEVIPDIQIDRTSGKVNVQYNVNEGDLYFVEQVKIRGNTKTRDIVIRRELRIRPGDAFDGTAVELSQQRLENTGFFEEVSYDTEAGTSPNQKNIIFRVKEKRTGELSFGAGVSSIDQFVGFAEISQKNFDLLNWPRLTGGGQSISLRGRWGTITRDFEFSFVEPYLFNKAVSLGLDVYNVRSENRNIDFREERLGAGITLSKALTDFLKTGLGYKLERVDVFDVESDAASDVLLFQGKSWLSRLRLFLNRDTRDNVFFPTKGYVAGLGGELIGTFLGGEEDYYILQGNFTKYWSFLDGRHIVEWRNRLGVSDDLGSDAVPVFDRFFAGGLGTVRGFNFRRVGPIAGGSAIGGSTMIISNLEYTFPVPYLENFKAAAFIDVGSIDLDSYDVEFGDFAASIGPGIKVRTPIGPVAVYYGLPISNRDTEDKNGRFEFSLGRGF